MRFDTATAAATTLARNGVRTAPTTLRGLGVAAIALLVANCASQTSGRAVDPKYGVSASPRVAAEGETIPKGGGRELVGRPYVIGGRTYVPQDNRGYVRDGLASWYGPAFHGRLTANGEIFDKYSIAAAHPTMPLPSYARVTNLQNRRSMIVRVNDRGPYHGNRIMDVSERVAEALSFKQAGTARVRVEYVGKASVRGSDDQKLMATLREDGRQAPFPGMTAPVMVAERNGGPPPRPQALAYRSQGVGDSEDLGVAPVPAPAARPAPVATASALRLDTSLFSGLFSTGPAQQDRSLDLGTIPGAATPVRRGTPVAELPPARSAQAALFLADPSVPRSRFTKDDPFKNLNPQRFVAMKGSTLTGLKH